MRKKSGFSLVELTIVLIIIGIIIAMFMGGISFMEKARIKSELGKLTKFSSAMTTYYAQNASVPDTIITMPSGATIKQEHIYEPTDFEDFGLTEEDFASSYGAERSAYLIVSCWMDDPDRNDNVSDFYFYDNTTADGPSHTICVYFNKFPGYFICNLEKSVDDKLVNNSDGLRWGETTTGVSLGANGSTFDNVTCDNVDEDNLEYGYRIFQY
jgi:prepilin-type N-terminal cleavage/methylation domain-containing protein